MANESIIKVFHAARQDIEIVWNMAKTIPHPIVDTQVAAMVLGYGDRSRTTSSSSASPAIRSTSRIASPTGRGGRSATRRSPTRLSDVTHLRDVYLKLAEDLDKRGRNNWVEAEMEVLTSPETYRADPERAWERLKSRVRKPKELAVLIEVAAWREREAQTRDVPRGA